MKHVIKNLTDVNSGEVFQNVEIVDEDDLPRGCGEVAWILADEDYERYVIYKDCVTALLYAVSDE